MAAREGKAGAQARAHTKQAAAKEGKAWAQARAHMEQEIM